jgi:hypothetical protein
MENNRPQAVFRLKKSNFPYELQIFKSIAGTLNTIRYAPLADLNPKLEKRRLSKAGNHNKDAYIKFLDTRSSLAN